jgi:hypothetical protein
MQNYGSGLEPKGLKEPNAQPALELPEVAHIEISAGVLFTDAPAVPWSLSRIRSLRVRYDADGKRLIIERAK